MKAKNNTWLWFALGLGSQLQLFGSSLSFSELYCLTAAPFFLGEEVLHMRKSGVSCFWGLSLFLLLGCLISCIVNGSPFFAITRGVATCSIFPCAIIVSHRMLRKNMGGFKWLVLGGAMSSILSAFIFQSAVDIIAADGRVSAQTVMSGPLFWISRIKALAFVPSAGWYLHVPLLVSVCVPLGLAAFAMATSASGRSAALGAVAYAAFAFIGGHKRSSMRKLSRYFIFYVLLGIVAVFLLKGLYTYAGENGLLNEKAQKKYQDQTKGGKGMMSLLVGGRMESFVGLLACRDRPIVGWGPWAIDRNGYTLEFLEKYGTQEDYENYYKMMQHKSGNGLIMCHAMLSQFWCWFGIAGLVFVLYAIFVFIRYVKSDVSIVPQWYYWLACSVGERFWNIFFSPFANRFGFTMAMVACLYAHAIRLGRANLDIEMAIEADKMERK